MANPAVNLADAVFVRDQYRAGDNLQARIVLHERFSTAKQKWFHWFWDHLDLPADARILEIGCGVGMLWRDNRARIPATWQLALSDFSLGMVESTRAATLRADFLQSDAQAIPFCDNYFDAVLANHMLYHVPNVARAIAEARRVLKLTGKFYAATNGETHLRELKTAVSEFLGADASPMLEANANRQFCLENGAEQIGMVFAQVKRFDHADAFVVTEVEPLMQYIMSGFMGKQVIGVERQDALCEFLAGCIKRDSAFRITKSTGLFVASN